MEIRNIEFCSDELALLELAIYKKTSSIHFPKGELKFPA